MIIFGILIVILFILLYVYNTRTLKKHDFQTRIHLLKNPKNINVLDKNTNYTHTYQYGLEDDGYLKLTCWGGTAFKIKCDSEDEAEKLIEPVRTMSEYEVSKHCRNNGWEFWNYYNEFYKKEIIYNKK